MAKSVCIVTLLIIFLLISTGIPKGKAQCMGTLSKTAPELICHETGGLRICNIVCNDEGHKRGECDTDFACSCYDC
ncbi:unnamed protein product [Brassica oleracea]